MIRSKPSSCAGCSIRDHGNDFSRVEGTGSNGVLLVGEASGEHEQREQAPFRSHAPAGAVLERCLRRMGLDRQQFAVTNCIRCRPRHNFLENAPWEYSALRQCRPNLDAAITQYRPRCIVALGGVALRELTGEAGEARGVTHLAGYVLPLASSRVPCDNCISHDSLDVPRNQRMTDSTCAQCHGTGFKTSPSTIPVIADYHPSYLRRGKASHQGVFSRIIQRSLAVASGRDKGYMWGVDPGDPSTWTQPDGSRLQYWTHPTVDQARAVLRYLEDNPNLPVAKDIETSESSSLDEDAREGFSDTEVRLFQLSYQPGTGIAIPYTGEFKPIVRRMLHLRNPFYGHNWDNFDHKVLRAAATREGWTYAPVQRCYDTLDMFHHWQPDLPAHLQFCSSFINFPFPWKHLAATDIEFYGICDVDADLRLGLFLMATLKKDNLWGEGEAYSLTTGYTGQEREVRPVLARMEDRGVPIDDAARLRLGAEFEAAQRELGEELAKRAPVECQRVHPKEGYAGIPPQIKTWIKEHCADEIVDDPKSPEAHSLYGRRFLNAELRFQDPPKTAKDGTIEEGEWYSYQRKTFEISSATLNASSGEPAVEKSSVTRWCRVYDFNPNSAPQLIAYMKAMGHKVPKSKIEDEEGNQKDTTAAKELQRLAVKTGDDFYLKVIEYRGLTKLRGTYYEGFRPASDGCVHTTFTYSTAIVQLGSRNPNCQNFPKLKPTPALAKAMRAMICAPEGKIITEMDWKSCHVITLGLLAGDDNYTRLGRLDIHSAVAGHFLGHWNLNEIIKETDDELMRRFKWLRSDPARKMVRDDQAKHCIASGELVLTNRGLVPIQNITLEHRLWDGVEWVSHDGLIDQGIREVITHDGLTATPDHEVVTANGAIKTHGEAASRMERLHATGNAGQAIRTIYRDLLEDSAQERIHSSEMQMLGLWSCEAGGQRQSIERQLHRMHLLWPVQIGASRSAGTAVRRDYSSLQQSEEFKLSPLWRSGYPVPIPIPQCVCAMGSEESSTQGLQGCGDRPQEQRWQLRTGQFKAIDTARTGTQQAHYSMDDVPRRKNISGRVQESLRAVMDRKVGEGRTDWRTDIRKVRVYDIVNAGPRRCFTVSGRLVFNCILGIGNGLRAKGAYERYMENFPPSQCLECHGSGKVDGVRGLKQCPKCKGSGRQSGLQTAEALLATCEALFPKVFEYQELQRKEAHERQQLRNDFGHMRRFYEVYRWDGKKGCWSHGDQAEEAVAYRLASVAHSHMRELLKELGRNGMAERYGLFNTIHDSIMLCHDESLKDDVLRDVIPVMTAESKVMPGLWLGVEASQGRRWSEMKEVELPSLNPATLPAMVTTTKLQEASA